MSGIQENQFYSIEQVPPPLLLSAVICDSVILDRITGKSSVIGIFSVINAHRYPARHPRLSVFCEMTGGRGKMPITAKLVDLKNDEKKLIEQSVEVVFSSPLAVNCVIFDFAGIPFPHEGEFRFQIYAGGDYCGERRIICQIQKEMDRGGPNE